VPTDRPGDSAAESGGDVAAVRDHLGDRAARRYRALTDIRQMHLSDFAEGRR